MGMASTMRKYLDRSGLPYEECQHPFEVTTSRIAEKARIPGWRMAKAVLLSGESGYKVAVLASPCRVDLATVSRIFDERVGLATEADINERFFDCDAGALPPLGQAYGVPVCVDDALCEQPDIYFEAGDHQTLVHMQGNDFRRLMADAVPGRFGR